jgi:hypothetical protein
MPLEGLPGGRGDEECPRMNHLLDLLIGAAERADRP